MSTQGTNKILTLPEGSDLAARAPIVGALQALEDCAAHGVAMQSNTSTTAYTTAFPFQELFTGLRILFMPLYSNSGAATLNINGKGAKKLLNAAGVQISTAGAIRARELYWLEYDTAFDGGAGAFKCYPMSMSITAGDGISLDQDADTRNVEVSASFINGKIRMTPEGGLAVKLTNHSGATTVHGSAVALASAHDDSFVLTSAYTDHGVGFLYGSGVTNGNDAWVVIAGLAEAILQANKAVSVGGWLDWSSATPGAVLPWSNYTGMQPFRAISLQTLSSQPTTQILRVMIQWMPN